MSETYTIIDVSPGELHAPAHQPVGRTTESGALNALKKSIQEVGLQYPPLVTRRPAGDGFTVVDGNRRIAAIKHLAWQKIPVLVSQGRDAELFSAVCGTTKPVTATQWVEVYLKGGDLPSGPTKVNIKKLDETVGKEFLQKLVDNGLSPQIWSLANRVIKYADINEDVKPKVLNWLIDNKITRQVAAWISGSSSPQHLRTAFEENRAPSV